MLRVVILATVTACAHAPPSDGRAELSRARIAVARGQTSRAIALYDRVPRFSPAWPRALLEASRERATAGHYAIALGYIMTLRAPQLRAWQFPEAYAIEAEIYFHHCYYARVLAIANEFRRLAPPADDATLVEHDLADSTLAGLEDASRAALEKLVDADHEQTRWSDTTIIDEEGHLYRFDGTYWPDELGNYRVPISSRCVLRRR